MAGCGFTMMFPITPLSENLLLSVLDEPDEIDFLAESDDFLVESDDFLAESDDFPGWFSSDFGFWGFWGSDFFGRGDESVDFLGRTLGLLMVVDNLGGK